MSEIELLHSHAATWLIAAPCIIVVTGYAINIVYDKIRGIKHNTEKYCMCHGKNGKHAIGCMYFKPNWYQKRFSVIEPEEGWEQYEKEVDRQHKLREGW